MKTITIPHPLREQVCLQAYLLDSGLKLGKEEKRPAVIICPGGGYVYHSEREAEPVALAYAARGMHAFVLRYSLGWNVAGFTPLQELDWAMELIRSRSEEWCVDGSKLALCGFSAGGHLALAGGLLGREKPNALILGYPAAQLPWQEMTLFARMLTGHEQPTPEEQGWLDLTTQVTSEAPPLFAYVTGEDTMVRGMTLALVNAYERHGLPCEFHLYQKGPHGYSLATPVSANGSAQMVNPHVAGWFPLSVSWLEQLFGAPELEDFNPSRIMEAFRELEARRS